MSTPRMSPPTAVSRRPPAPVFTAEWAAGGEPGGTVDTYAIESDGLRRSFIWASAGDKLKVQNHWVGGESTPLPQAQFVSGNDKRLQWYVEPP